MIVNKIVSEETRVLDPDYGRVSAVVSTEARDRDGDIIRQDYWDLKNFMAHPVLLSSHDYGSVRSQIGEWESLEVKDHKLQGVARYYINEGNEEADWAFKLAAKGRAAYSVGFVPVMDKAENLPDQQGYEFKGQELLEVSHVTVPSNPQALQIARGLVHPVVKEIIEAELQDLGIDPEIAAPRSATSSSRELLDLVEKVISRIARQCAGPNQFGIERPRWSRDLESQEDGGEGGSPTLVGPTAQSADSVEGPRQNRDIDILSLIGGTNG